MSDASRQTFDFEKAAELRKTIKGKIDEIDTMLNNIKKTVEGVRAWWSGGSEDGFIQNFEKTKKMIRKGLQDWLNDYDNLMREVEKAKKEEDKNLETALKK